MEDKTEVLYNGACPICSREIGQYERISTSASVQIAFHDLNDPEHLAAWGVCAQDAAKRLHLRRNGALYAGLPAFIQLWREMPQTRWLAVLFSLPGLNWIAAKTYDHILAPALYARHLRRQQRQNRDRTIGAP